MSIDAESLGSYASSRLITEPITRMDGFIISAHEYEDSNEQMRFEVKVHENDGWRSNSSFYSKLELEIIGEGSFHAGLIIACRAVYDLDIANPPHGRPFDGLLLGRPL